MLSDQPSACFARSNGASIKIDIRGNTLDSTYQ
jgi:hypothetical protein